MIHNDIRDLIGSSLDKFKQLGYALQFMEFNKITGAESDDELFAICKRTKLNPSASVGAKMHASLLLADLVSVDEFPVRVHIEEVANHVLKLSEQEFISKELSHLREITKKKCKEIEQRSNHILIKCLRVLEIGLFQYVSSSDSLKEKLARFDIVNFYRETQKDILSVVQSLGAIVTSMSLGDSGLIIKIDTSATSRVGIVIDREGRTQKQRPNAISVSDSHLLTSVQNKVEKLVSQFNEAA